MAENPKVEMVLFIFNFLKYEIKKLIPSKSPPKIRRESIINSGEKEIQIFEPNKLNKIL